MNYESLVDSITPEALQSLSLPAAFDEAVHMTAVDIDDFLKQEERPVTTFDKKISAHREAALSHVMTFHHRQKFDRIDLLAWPPSLFIPKNANALDYWFRPAPDEQRYALGWIFPATAPANRASPEDGTAFSFSELQSANPGRAQSSESGIGVLYRPAMTLGTIDLEPHVNCSGTLRTFLDFFPQLAAGHVEVKAQLLLAAWQQIPTGFDLLGFKQFEVATTDRRDQSHGPELISFTRSFAGSDLSAPFVVQRGRTYLLGVVGRISVRSTLTSTNGAPLPPIGSTQLRVFGWLSCVVPQINVWVKRIDIP
jgi:hypothetical protein